MGGAGTGNDDTVEVKLDTIGCVELGTDCKPRKESTLTVIFTCHTNFIAFVFETFDESYLSSIPYSGCIFPLNEIWSFHLFGYSSSAEVDSSNS